MDYAIREAVDADATYDRLIASMDRLRERDRGRRCSPRPIGGGVRLMQCAALGCGTATGHSVLYCIHVDARRVVSRGLTPLR